MESKGLNVFDWLNSITYSKSLEMDSSNKTSYDPFIALKGLMQHQDTVLYACEMNKYWELDKELQYDYLKNAIRKKKRYGKWAKPIKDEKYEIVALYYPELSKTKILQILPFINNEDLKEMEESMFRGGKINQNEIDKIK